MEKTKAEKLLQLIKKQGMIKTTDIVKQGFSREYIKRFYDQGLLVKLSRGIYMLSDAPIKENLSLAEVSKRVPNGVICLLSALRFHGLTTQSPYEVWVAIGHKTHPPKLDSTSIHVNYFSSKALDLGVEEHIIAGVNVKIFSAAKTVIDCFKFRNKIGLDIAIEALKDCWYQHKSTLAELWHFAKACRMQNVIRPYLEVVTNG
ncbi:MAG: hypothetical protein FD167_4003 [bacterium]|nr:MAG: hypothetical protein FD167_4003 [bacterium]